MLRRDCYFGTARGTGRSFFVVGDCIGLVCRERS
uniref:Uncharacterized protein n=1 Tax=Siphoviridae sp. ctBCI9 TaxID=2825373 RepID=A0A8S5Q8B8_9CAUD|nr:MAG TPA: hypothetical protein [Siphoviridae sp. ctBCI9]